MDDSLNFQVLEILKCPGCFQYMKEEIYECYAGHSFCKTCWYSEECPTCKGALTDIRNHSLESISKALQYPCKNRSFGCLKLFKCDELKEHSQYCDFKHYSCNLQKSCTWQGLRSELQKHYLENHESSILFGETATCLWTPNKPETAVQLMLAHNEMFYVHRMLKNGMMYWVVQYIGRSEDMIMFSFHLTIYSDQYEDRRIKFSEICHDDLVRDINEIIETGFSVGVPLNILETYKDTYGVVFYKIAIVQT